MKKPGMIFAVALVIASCGKQGVIEDLATARWNGYGKYFKSGEQVHTLWAGQNIDVGTVTYGIDDNANFYATYDCSASGWLISETHMFAGDKAGMPLNKPGAPKIGLFPYSGNHDPWISNYTYTVPLTQLPPCESPGFVVAAHCIVHSPYGQTETAWAEGDFTFSDKGWGWYDDYYYSPSTGSVIIYGTLVTEDSLRLYHFDVINNVGDLMFKEFVGNSSGTYDGAAYDPGSGLFFFTNYNTGELWINQLQGEGPSVSAGFLSGTSASGTYYNEAYYYVNEDQNTINKITFTTNWIISAEMILDTIPGILIVNDIAMSPSGDFLYIMGQLNNGGTELLSWDMTSHTFYTMSISINDGAQITFGSDGELYAIAPAIEGSGISLVYSLDTSNGILEEITGGAGISIVDPFSDLATGP